MNRLETLRQRAQEKAQEMDRRYFEEHPQQRCYFREALPGEENSVGYAPDYVEVTQVAPGVRTRRFVKCFSDVDGV